MQENLWNKNFLLACVANFSLFFAFYMLMPVLPLYLSNDMGADKSQVGMVLSSYVIMALLIRPFAGFFVDTMPRKILLLVSFALYMLCFSGYIVAGTLLIFTLFRAIHGAIFGITTVSVSTIAIDVMPSQRRGEGIGYFGVMGNLAMATGPMISLMVYEQTQNFEQLVMISMGMALLGFTLSSLLKTKKRELLTHVEPLSLDRFILIKGLRGALAMVLLAFGYGILNTYIALYGKQVMGIESGAGQFFLYFAGGLIVSRLISGRFINKGHFKGVAVSGALLLMISFTLFVSLHTAFIFYAVGVTMGIGYGMLAPTFQTMSINLAPHNKRGTANATYLASWDLGIGVGILCGGVIADVASLTTAFASAIVLQLAGLLVYLFMVAPYYEKNRLR